MYRREVILAVGAATAGCVSTSGGGEEANGGDGGSQGASFTTQADEKIYSDTTYPNELQEGDQLRVTVENERGYAAYVHIWSEETDEDLGSGDVQTKSTFDVTAEVSGVYYVDVLPDQLARVTIETTT